MEIYLKKTIIRNANRGITKNETIQQLVRFVQKHVSALKSLPDFRNYQQAIEFWIQEYVNRYYKAVDAGRYAAISAILVIAAKKRAPEHVLNKIQTITPESSFVSVAAALSDEKTLDYFKRGYPVVTNYMKTVRQRMKELALSGFSEKPVYDSKRGRYYHGRSLLASAERQIRFEGQMQKLEQMRNNGVQIAWVTSHANCSERCAPWQGRLYTLDGKTRTIDGQMAEPIEKAINVFCTTKSGKVWRNGLFGFNCRHDLKEYTPGSTVPITYTEKQMERQRAIDKKQRAYERQLYQLDRLRACYESSADPEAVKLVQDYKRQFQQLESEYVAYSKQMNVPVYPERYKTWLYER